MSTSLRLGLALSGGGARSLSHIGVLKVLEREHIPVDCFAGTSMGGLIAAAAASGISATDMETEALRYARRRQRLKLLDRVPTLRALFSGSRLRRYLDQRFGKDRTFADLQLPLVLAATDLRSGREVALRNGSLVDALRATMSVPSFFAPVEHDGMRLVDGGLLNNLPADLLRGMGAESLVAVDVLPSFAGNMPGGETVTETLLPPFFPPAARDLFTVGLLMVSELTEAKLARAKPDLVLRPELPPEVTILTGFSRAAELMAAGEAAAEAALPRLRELCKT